MIADMTLEDRSREIQDRYNAQEQMRKQHLDAANKCLLEMARLEGEAKVVQEMIAERPQAKVSKKATTIAAVPEED